MSRQLALLPSPCAVPSSSSIVYLRDDERSEAADSGSGTLGQHRRRAQVHSSPVSVKKIKF